MQFDASNLVNVLIAVFGSGGVLAILARFWLRKHGLQNGTIKEMTSVAQRTENKLDKLSEEVGNIKVALAAAKGEMTSVSYDVVKEHEIRYHKRGLV